MLYDKIEANYTRESPGVNVQKSTTTKRKIDSVLKPRTVNQILTPPPILVDNVKSVEVKSASKKAKNLAKGGIENELPSFATKSAPILNFERYGSSPVPDKRRGSSGDECEWDEQNEASPSW